MVENIREAEPRVGVRKLHHRLNKEKRVIGRDALFYLLRQENKLIKRKKKYCKTTYSKHKYAVAPNRVKHLEVTKPKQVLVSDITYLSLRRGQKAYLFLVTDMYSRHIVGFHVSRDLSHHAALLALDNAVRLMGDTTGIVHHSDRGSQYCCHEYLGYLHQYLMIPSMTDESHCYQNAIAERVNGILKDEFNLDATFESFDELQQAVVKSIMVYNTIRTHGSLNLKTPLEVFEEAA